MSKNRKYVDVALSILFIVSTILGYYKDISHMSEYCFVSGIVVGIIFFVSFLRQKLQDRLLPAWIYLACLVDIFIILIAFIIPMFARYFGYNFNPFGYYMIKVSRTIIGWLI